MRGEFPTQYCFTLSFHFFCFLHSPQYIKLQPHTSTFLDISNPRAVLERALRTYSALTLNDVIALPYNNRVYHLRWENHYFVILFILFYFIFILFSFILFYFVYLLLNFVCFIFLSIFSSYC